MKTNALEMALDDIVNELDRLTQKDTQFGIEQKWLDKSSLIRAALKSHIDNDGWKLIDADAKDGREILSVSWHTNHLGEKSPKYRLSSWIKGTVNNPEPRWSSATGTHYRELPPPKGE